MVQVRAPLALEVVHLELLLIVNMAPTILRILAAIIAQDHKVLVVDLAGMEVQLELMVKLSHLLSR